MESPQAYSSMVEPVFHRYLVVGSSPAAPTILKDELLNDVSV